MVDCATCATCGLLSSHFGQMFLELRTCLVQGFTVVLFLYLLCVYLYYQPGESYGAPLPLPASHYQTQKIWASMGLCYSHNTEKHGKGKYPYKDVAPLALLLWRYHLPQVQTLVRIVYTEPELSDFMRYYGAMLERAGAVVEWLPAGDMDCVLKSQLVRIFAVDNEAVADTDLVITVDINLFVMTEEILSPLLSQPSMTAWVPQYADTADISTGRGETFNQNLVAMRAADWRKITGYQGDLTELVRHYREDLAVVDSQSSWYTDQLITTWALLNSRVCTVPATSGLWRMPGLKFDPNLDDSATCWHGRGYKDCNRLVHIVYGGCKWWHFYPDQTFQDHLDKFYELTNNTIALDLQILTK